MARQHIFLSFELCIKCDSSSYLLISCIFLISFQQFNKKIAFVCIADQTNNRSSVYSCSLATRMSNTESMTKNGGDNRVKQSIWRCISINERRVAARIGILTYSVALSSHGKSMDSRSSDLTTQSTPRSHLC